MPSTLTWLDTSEHDRRRALDVIDLFSVRDTRDELGMAGVRDAWADRLSPGTSTIQTRARYFFFVPWIYQRLERAGSGRNDIERAARNQELRLIDAITTTDQEAVPIGARAGRGLKRLPSGIYWHGLSRLGIRLWDGSQAAFHRAFGTMHDNAWHPHLPEPPGGFPDRAVLGLEVAEAEFLRDQVRARATGSMLAFLMDREGLREGARFPWEHPLRAEMPEELSRSLDHAEAFAVVMHGAALLYNRMLAERLGAWSSLDGVALVDDYGKQFESWVADVETWRDCAEHWDRAEFWRLTREMAPRLPASAENFCETWIDLALGADNPRSLVHDTTTRDLIERREIRLKRNRSRLRHREHLERWGGAAGAARINYRWPITERLVRDVQVGLGQA